MCPPENIHVYGHVAVFGRAHRPSPTVTVNVDGHSMTHPEDETTTPTDRALHGANFFVANFFATIIIKKSIRENPRRNPRHPRFMKQLNPTYLRVS